MIFKATYYRLYFLKPWTHVHDFVYIHFNVMDLYLLQLYTRNLHLDEDVDLQIMAASCNGFVGADLEALCREAAKLAYHRMSNLYEGDKVLKLLMEDWESAKSLVRPSMTRGVTKEISTVLWDDVGGLKDLKVVYFMFKFSPKQKPVSMVIFLLLQKKLQQAVEWPIKHSAAFARLGISPVRGVLLHGPPGCSKTTLAKAAAYAAQASFFSLRFVIEGHLSDRKYLSFYLKHIARNGFSADLFIIWYHVGFIFSLPQLAWD
jgi:hypothetical protein